MKFTKQKETEILRVMEEYWSTYFKASADYWAACLPDLFRNIAPTQAEIMNSKVAAVDYTRRVINQMQGKVELRNKKTEIIPFDAHVLVHERGEVYVQSDEGWIYYTPFRLSSLLEKTTNGWKIRQQHGSYPQGRSETGAAFASEQLKAENTKLREVVKSRTAELERKNRELEIEAALEKVRSRSMAMRKSEELSDLSLELVSQVHGLGIETWFCAFNIYDDDPRGSLEWGSNGQGVFPRYRTPREGIFLHYYETGQSGEDFLVYEFDEAACPAHYEYLCSLPGVGEQLLKMKAAGLSFPTSQIDHVAFFKYGYILFITFEPAPEAYEIFQRFAKAFEQTYTRFLDLQRSEAQMREARIEAALERVRSSTVAMKRTDELQDVINSVHQQLKRLDIQISGGAYVVINADIETDYSFWGASAHADYMQRAQVPPLDRPIFTNILNRIKNDRGFFAEAHTYEEKMEYFHHLLSHPPLLHLPPKQKQELLSREGGYHRSSYISEHTTVTIINHHGRKFTDEENDILIRLAKVFEQAYIRFLDLEKAEKQARQIEIVFQENQRLLHSILPEPIAEQIRKGEKTIVKRYDQASILFADIVGFTKLSERISPAKVVDILNSLFSRFDDLTDRYGLEKIKTIGDAYMVAAGVPEERPDHARTIFQFAQDMLRSLEAYNRDTGRQLDIRIGICSGPVVAGVIGKKKFAYDLWGDTVNTAARMEAYGRAGKIQLAPPSYELLKNDFAFDKVSKVQIKGKGLMDVYLWRS